MCAWADESILPPLRRDAELVRDWVLDNGHLELAKPLVFADKQRASDLSGLAVLITKATGFYNPVNSVVVPIITFGEVTIAPRGGGR